jgi:hypothetical protein
MPGPLPNPHRIRRNKPTPPAAVLPAEGRTGPIPRPPKATVLGEAGKAWWKWAWRTPQSTAWDPGALYAIARRASLEDDLAALADVEGLDWDELADAPTIREFRRIVSSLSAMVSGRVTLLKECRELDDRLGLTPKGRLALRWPIAPTAEPEAEAAPSSSRRLRAVDSALIGA